MSRMDLTNDSFRDVRMLWSTKYNCPVYVVGNVEDVPIQTFIPMTGGYFEEYIEPSQPQTGGSDNE